MLIDLLLLAAGIGLLTLGGEALIRGALAAAHRLGVSPLLAGLVIVGFGTSAPELAVSVDAALSASPDIAVGNVVGSNIGNILLILGLCAVITPLTITVAGLRRDGASMVAASALVGAMITIDGAVGRIDAVLLLTALATYLVWTYRSESGRNIPAAEVHRAEAEALPMQPRTAAMTAVTLIAGLGVLVLGSRLLLAGAIGIARDAGVPESVIGLTLVAVGTSLPELAVSVLAALRRQSDVAVGNILGSNIFNALGILAVAALLQPLPVAGRILAVDQWVMHGAALALVMLLISGRRLDRREGAALLAAYGLYLVFGIGAGTGG